MLHVRNWGDVVLSPTYDTYMHVSARVEVWNHRCPPPRWPPGNGQECERKAEGAG